MVPITCLFQKLASLAHAGVPIFMVGVGVGVPYLGNVVGAVAKLAQGIGIQAQDIVGW